LSFLGVAKGMCAVKLAHMSGYWNGLLAHFLFQG